MLDATVKGIVVLVVAGALSLTFRRASAATRHLIWLLAVVSLVALPVLSVMTPRWRIPILPEWAITLAQPEAEPPATEEEKSAEPTPAAGTPDDVPLVPQEVEEEPRHLPRAPIEPPTEVTPKPAAMTPEGRPAEEASKPPIWPLWVLLIWGAGTLLVLGRLLCGTVGMWRLAHGARRLAGGSWKSLVGGISAQLGLKRQVVVLQSDRAAMPMTWGILRPVALLPADADNWSEDRKRIVMLHELAHVKRWDCLTQMAAQLACAVHWFNPLAWLAARQVRIERERACDDLVLRSGFKPSDYGQHLLDIVQSLRSPLCTSLTSVSIARKSHFESRLLAILDPMRSRRALTRLAVIIGLCLGVCVILPLGSMRLATRAEAGKFLAHAASERLWRENGGDSYEILVKVISGPVAVENEYRIRVEEGRVVWAERRMSPTGLRPDIPFKAVRPETVSQYTVTGLFRRVSRARSREDEILFDRTVDFHPTLGYPRKIVHKPKPRSGVVDGFSSVEVLSLDLNPEPDDPPWGEAVEGVQVRLRADKMQWKADERPTLKVALRNDGTGKFSGLISGQQMEVDGRWYVYPAW
ncbi:MAG: hypothetical protein AMK75_05810, partial [Planctomycetes bacterium SM23_65]